ncbi:MAG: acyl-CoA ligase (AMP-forming), exosortase A system-associated [Gammaproteobacteria bacterium]|nr:acyl-CoA ligase (AMP-forming), exosortase A system-associated [Gammaproteobacteria bacterium]
MTELLHELIMSSARRHGARPAVTDAARTVTYEQLALGIERLAAGLADAGMHRGTRVAVYLPKCLEAVEAMFAVAMGGGIFVPVNPLLRPAQVAYILQDSGAGLLLTSAERLAVLATELDACSELRTVVTVEATDASRQAALRVVSMTALRDEAPALAAPCVIDEDVASIFYTSGSTGRPKGVVLSHRNMVAGAHSVASYLENRLEDSILAVLPLSFDYGFSQLTTAFHSAARVVLLNYLLPNDVLRTLEREHITGLAGVPPLWIQLAALDWPEAAGARLRYITSSGGKLPLTTVRKLRQKLPATRLYLMYGLTEAFRSTYLPPELVDQRPTSIGKAIPNAEVLVVRPDGTECGVDEPGELVHRGALVARGYWRDPERSRERFRPAPGQLPGLPLPEIAVWSGDTVQRDAEGFLYFVGRHDETIKTSGYRVSPTEVEEVLYATQMVAGAVAFGVYHASLGQSIAVAVEAAGGQLPDTGRLLAECRKALPPFMVPATVIWEAELPRNPNGKLDRSAIIGRLRPQLEAAHAPDQ